jgi:hypothetical protein
MTHQKDLLFVVVEEGRLLSRFRHLRFSGAAVHIFEHCIRRS